MLDDYKLAFTVASLADVGVIAGILVGSAISANALSILPAEAWVLQHQAADRLFSKIMPVLMWSGVLCLGANSFFAREQARLCFAVAAALYALVILVSVVREVPLNRRIKSWSADSPPDDWALVRHTWSSGHALRTGLAVAGLVIGLFASLEIW